MKSPYECKSSMEAKELPEQGIGYNDESIRIDPLVVVLKVGPCEMTVSMKRFESWARWYLGAERSDSEEGR